MYNKKDIQFVGKYDYDELSAKKFASCGVKTFSVNIFKWGLTSNGKSMKPLKCEVRVSGKPENIEEVFRACDSVVEQLNGVTWDGSKTVTVK